MPHRPFVPGSVFRAARILAGITQIELGEKIGRDRSAISRVENRGAKVVMFHNATQALNTSLRALKITTREFMQGGYWPDGTMAVSRERYEDLTAINRTPERD